MTFLFPYFCQVVGPPARGRKVVIMGDTTHSEGIIDIARNCDVRSSVHGKH